MTIRVLRRLAAIAVSVAVLGACGPLLAPAPTEPQDHRTADGCATTTPTAPEVVCLAVDCPEVRP